MKLMIRKIVKSDRTQTNAAHARALMNYITRPDAVMSPDESDSESGFEKCVHFRTWNAAKDNDVAAVTEEMETLCKTAKWGGQSKISSHWVLSWKIEDYEVAPSFEEMEWSARELMADLGYTDEHVMAMAVHADTDKPHCHVVANRVSKATGEILKEGADWWKRESQKALARICFQKGWEQADGATYEATGELEKVKSPDAWIPGQEVDRVRVKVKPIPRQEQGEKKRPPRQGNMQSEIKTGYLSIQGLLDRQLRFAFAGLESREAGKWKWGEIYTELAKYGVEVAIRQHGQKEGLAYTVDGLRWYSASEMGGTRYGLDNLTQMAGGKRIRQPRDQIHSMAEDVRKSLLKARSSMGSDYATGALPYTPEEIEKVRRLPLDQIAKDFKIKEDYTKDSRVQNSIDLMKYYRGRTYVDAVQDLAVTYRDIIRPRPAEDLGSIRDSPHEDDDSHGQITGITPLDEAIRERMRRPAPLMSSGRKKKDKPKKASDSQSEERKPEPDTIMPLEPEVITEDESGPLPALEPRRLWDATAPLQTVRDALDTGIDEAYPGIGYDRRFELLVQGLASWDASAEDKAETIARVALDLALLDEDDALRLMAEKCGQLPYEIRHQLDRWENADGDNWMNPPGMETDIRQMTAFQAAQYESDHPDMVMDIEHGPR